MTGAGPITLRSDDGATSATFLPGANLVCSELRHEGADWLDPVRALESVATGKDYGISLVHPWAGRLSGFGYEAAGQTVAFPQDAAPLKLDKQGLPIHGVRDSYLRWEVVEQTGRRLTARMVWSEPDVLEVFPYPHELTVTATLDTARLHMETVLRPTGDAAVPVSFGYHAFLRIPNSARAGWTLRLDGSQRILVDETQMPTGLTETISGDLVLGDAGVNDDIGGLVPNAPLSFDDGESSVTLVVEDGYSAAHVFAPADWNLVSFEPQVAPANALKSGDGLPVVEPGNVLRTAFAIVIDR